MAALKFQSAHEVVGFGKKNKRTQMTLDAPNFRMVEKVATHHRHRQPLGKTQRRQ